MTPAAKIRLLLALLFGSLLLMAVIVQKTYTPRHNLEQTAQILENNLQNKERIIQDHLEDTAFFNSLKKTPANTGSAFKLIETFTTNQNIWVNTYRNNQLVFWSGIKVIPLQPVKIHEGSSFIQEPNGYYECIKKTDGDFSAIFMIPVKIKYAFENKYLHNQLADNLIKDHNIDIADFTDPNIIAIHNLNNHYLFSVKLVNNDVNSNFFWFEAILYLLCFCILCMLINNVSNYIIKQGYVIAGVGCLAVFIVLIRFIALYYNWPDFASTTKLFSPELYGSSWLYPSLGDFCINILMLSWLVAFIYAHREQLALYLSARVNGYIIVILCTLILVAVSTSLLSLFHGLVINSKINFDVNNVLNLSSYSMLGVLMLCFSFLMFYLLDEVFLTLCLKLTVPLSHQVILLSLGVIISSAVMAWYYEFTLFYLLWMLIVIMRGFSYLHMHKRLSAVMFVCIVLICAFISSVKLNHFQALKEYDTRKLLIEKLGNADDAMADLQFKRIEDQIAADPTIAKYLTDTAHNADILKNYFQKRYFDGYLSRYDLQLHAFDDKSKSATTDKKYELSDFKDMVLYGSLAKVSGKFYRDNESFGSQSYLGLLPVFKDDKLLGTIVAVLTTKALQASNSFPELLMEGENESGTEFKNYSYAFYDDGRLFSQSGKYVYDVVNTDFQAKLRQYAFKTTYLDKSVWRSNTPWYESLNEFSHLIYRPNPRNMIVVSKEENIILNAVTSLTFFFIVFLMFSALIIVIRWVWQRLQIAYIQDNRLRWSFKFNADRILYKTRIQFSMVFTVVVTLLLVGFITYLTISRQYQTQQDNSIRDKTKRIAQFLQEGMFSKGINNISDQDRTNFDQYASANSADLVLFDTEGLPVLTTQPKMFDDGIVARRINSKAFLYLSKLQRSEFINEERIGELNYKAAYAPLRNTHNETIAFLQLPYFSNESDYRERIGSLLNAMINIYALVFIGIGLFAVITARQITNPLNFIQQSISNTIYGKKNEPIKWERDDEIGALVTEYNKMISALENSAQKLAQSERESAWREMAKQVAHEIKNPLTPLKLGLQLLEKSWRDKDPRFDQKFERFSKSFVEQIESLSSIASEFSAFAKMPDTRIERINFFEMLNQAVIIFRQMENVKILYQPPTEPFVINADRDQMLRCFNNLLKNAIEATPSDRLVIIDIAFQLTGKNILVSIKDNGNGIPENMREKIFEPNFTTKSSGTGLGLAFVKNSIENAGGKVWFDTETGVGTTFYLSLPLAG